jgi:nucleotide-binding universal stress UspA family protein
MPFTHILVPVAGHPADEEAVRLAVQIARQDRAKLLAVHVIEVQRNLPLNVENLPQVSHGEAVLEHIEKVAKANKGSIETELLQARSAGPALIDDARERGIDLIVMGIPYRAPLGEFRIGTTANYILKNAACPVWLCRESPQKNPKADQK